jgi:hypothetical protein
MAQIRGFTSVAPPVSCSDIRRTYGAQPDRERSIRAPDDVEDFHQRALHVQEFRMGEKAQSRLLSGLRYRLTVPNGIAPMTVARTNLLT